MSLLIKYLLKIPNKRRLNSHQVSGFTMVELLVATVMSFLIITPILAFAVSILNDDVKEQAKASTELELQSAMDYIQQDISQAYYIYDGLGVNELISRSQLPANGQPVLVFWKRELVRNAINVTTQSPSPCLSPAADDTSTTPICDDTYVDSLVAYYLVKDPDNQPTKWCQPGTGSCPARIERWSIKDGVKNGSGVYVCGTEGRDTTCDTQDKLTFKRSLGMPYTRTDGTPNGTKFNFSTANTWTKSSEAYDTTTQILVNYVDAQVIPRTDTTLATGFCVNTLGVNKTASPTPTEINYRIGTNDPARLNFTGFSGCVDSSRNIAQITIRGDARRRNEAKNVYCPSVSPAPAGQTVPQPNYCPTVTGQIGGRSGFGQ